MAESKSSGSKFTPEERAAMKQRVKELQELQEQQSPAEALQSVLDKIASLDETDKTNAERIHSIVMGAAPSLAAKLLYGSPAYATAEGKPVLFYQERARFKARNGNRTFFGSAQLDEGTMWPPSYAITKSYRPMRRSSRSWYGKPLASSDSHRPDTGLEATRAGCLPGKRGD